MASPPPAPPWAPLSVAGTVPWWPHQTPEQARARATGWASRWQALAWGRRRRGRSPLTDRALGFPQLHPRCSRPVVLHLPSDTPTLPALGVWEGPPGDEPVEGRVKLKEAWPGTEASACPGDPGGWKGGAQSWGSCSASLTGQLQLGSSPWPQNLPRLPCALAGPQTPRWRRPAWCPGQASHSTSCSVLFTSLQPASHPRPGSQAGLQTAWAPPEPQQGRRAGLWAPGAKVRAEGEGAGWIEPLGADLSPSQASRTQGAFSTNEQHEQPASWGGRQPAASLLFPLLRAGPRPASPPLSSPRLLPPKSTWGPTPALHSVPCWEASHMRVGTCPRLAEAKGTTVPARCPLTPVRILTGPFTPPRFPDKLHLCQRSQRPSEWPPAPRPDGNGEVEAHRDPRLAKDQAAPRNLKQGPPEPHPPRQPGLCQGAGRSVGVRLGPEDGPRPTSSPGPRHMPVADSGRPGPVLRSP